MKRSAILFPIALALGVMILAPRAGAQAQDAREGPIEIEKCQTINQPGSYKLVNNLTFKGPVNGTCLSITTSSVTIDLAGFTISGPGCSGVECEGTRAIHAGENNTGIAVRNGSISGFPGAVELLGSGSIVEGLRVSEGVFGLVGITATGIVRGNIVVGQHSFVGIATGIAATGIITGNYVSESDNGIAVLAGSTVIGNLATNNTGSNRFGGIGVNCPSNVIDNTVVSFSDDGSMLVLNGQGCNSTNNVEGRLP
jgi:hypothetical protein